MRFMGADLVQTTDDRVPAPGRARISVLLSGAVEARFADSGNRQQTVVLLESRKNAGDLLDRAGSIVVVVASHRDDIARAEGAGSFTGWTRVALSDAASDATLGYSVGVGVQLS